MNRQEEHIAELEERMRGLSRQVWDLAEVGFKEHASAGLLAQACREEGFEVETGVAGMPTAFVARWGQGNPWWGSWRNTMPCRVCPRKSASRRSRWRKESRATGAAIICWGWQPWGLLLP
jgi:hypothetical protein